jgi:hypothetical protein
MAKVPHLERHGGATEPRSWTGLHGAFLAGHERLEIIGKHSKKVVATRLICSANLEQRKLTSTLSKAMLQGLLQEVRLKHVEGLRRSLSGAGRALVLVVADLRSRTVRLKPMLT